VALDDAKKDFQELPRLLNGQFHYERDRKREHPSAPIQVVFLAEA
jgi:hypothetical protein